MADSYRTIRHKICKRLGIQYYAGCRNLPVQPRITIWLKRRTSIAEAEAEAFNFVIITNSRNLSYMRY